MTKNFDKRLKRKITDRNTEVSTSVCRHYYSIYTVDNRQNGLRHSVDIMTLGMDH